MLEWQHNTRLREVGYLGFCFHSDLIGRILLEQEVDYLLVRVDVRFLETANQLFLLLVSSALGHAVSTADAVLFVGKRNSHTATPPCTPLISQVSKNF